MIVSRIHWNRLLLSALALVSLTDCGEKPEDVRIGFCRALVLTQLPAVNTPTWGETTTEPRGHEDLLVRIRFAPPNAGEAICRYPYRAVEDTALTLADPLAAYGTSPTSMRLNGHELSRPALAAAIVDAVALQARGLVNRARSAPRPDDAH